MTRTEKLELCIGQASAKEKPFLQELTTTNINEKENLNGPHTVQLVQEIIYKIMSVQLIVIQGTGKTVCILFVKTVMQHV